MVASNKIIVIVLSLFFSLITSSYQSTTETSNDSNLFYKSSCSSSKEEIVNLAEFHSGSLDGKGYYSNCAGNNNNNNSYCSWLLKFGHSNNNNNATIADLDSIMISFNNNFDITPIIDDDYCRNNDTAANNNNNNNNNTINGLGEEDKDVDEEEYDDYPPCYFNYLKISYFNETTGEKDEFIGKYCGDGLVPTIFTQPWRSVIIEFQLTLPYNSFQLNFERVAATDANNNSTSTTDSNDEQCSTGNDNYFKCPGEKRRCIPTSFLCDANVDCKNGADEGAICNGSELLRVKQQTKAAKSTDSGCGSDRYQGGMAGVFSSENYPRHYPNDARCIWYVTTAPGTKIMLSFNSIFSIEPGKLAMAEDCPYDSLTFYALDDDATSDDASSSSEQTHLTLLGRRCGQKAPKSFITPNNAILVVFETDNANTGAGFRLHWKAISKERAEALSGTKSPRVTTTITALPLLQTFKQPACSNADGDVLTAKRGTIRSPGFGLSTYPQNVTCQWIIRPNLPDGKVVKSVEIRFYDFNVQPSEKCRLDSVQIVFNDNKNQRRRGKYCDSNRPVVGDGLLAETNSDVYVIFRSDSALQARGFELGYYVTTQSRKDMARPSKKRLRPVKKLFSMNSRCGVASTRPPAYSDKFDRIVGGQITAPFSWPFIAELLFQGQHLCGATILNEKWLITAAHCFRQGRGFTKGWQVAIGQPNRYYNQQQQQSSSSVLYLQIDKIFVHRHYGRDKNPKAYDIALVKLRDSPLNFQNSDNSNNFPAAPACLPTRDIKAGVDRCYIIGYGATQGTGAEGYLKQALVPIIESDDCRRMNLYYSTLVNSKMFCAGYQSGGIDSCQGDSGGPLVCFVQGRWEIHGIVSFGKGCAGANAPGVYTRVYTYTNSWIRKVVEAFDNPNEQTMAKFYN